MSQKKQRGKTLGKEQHRGGGNERDPARPPVRVGCFLQTFTRRQALPCTRTQALYLPLLAPATREQCQALSAECSEGLGPGCAVCRTVYYGGNIA